LAHPDGGVTNGRGVTKDRGLNSIGDRGLKTIADHGLTTIADHGLTTAARRVRNAARQVADSRARTQQGRRRSARLTPLCLRAEFVRRCAASQKSSANRHIFTTLSHSKRDGLTQS